MPVFVARFKNNGHFFSRHYTVSDQKKAKKRAEKAGLGRILSIRKVKRDEVIGTVESMNLKDIIGVTPKVYNPNIGIVFEDTNIGDIIYSGKKPSKRSRRRFYKKKKDKIED